MWLRCVMVMDGSLWAVMSVDVVAVICVVTVQVMGIYVLDVLCIRPITVMIMCDAVYQW
jgi:hypothetical protein